MLRTSFGEGWTVTPRRSMFASGGATTSEEVVLPHDALRLQQRTPDSPNGAHTGYFPSAHVVYEKAFQVPDDWAGKTVFVEFEGVYRDAVVSLNGDFVGQRPSGYSVFTVDLTSGLVAGATNVLRVEARTHQDSRWYSGVGIHRDVWLAVAEPVHIPLQSVGITTPAVDTDLAHVQIDLEVRNVSGSRRAVRLRSRVARTDGTVVSETTQPVTVAAYESAAVRLAHYIDSPELWSIDRPWLYVSDVAVMDGESGEVLDTDVTRFGVRTVQVDPRRGLRINGIGLKLRGGCVHHDNGPLGAVSIARAERRKAEILKNAGFNAVRSAHNPASRAFLDACDEVGLVVIDELTDVWTVGKSSYDTALTFPEWWERDLESLVANARNHPSVVMYSIGNEIPEIGRPSGAVWGRRLAAKVRALDPTRPVTNAVNALMTLVDGRSVSMIDGRVTTHPDDVGTDFNALLALAANDDFGASDVATARTEEAHAQVDVAGINYADARYDLDAELFPDRVLVGSETFPSRLDRQWARVMDHPQVIGDFAWTAWDHLGEAGTGRAVYVDEDNAQESPYPWLLSHAGTIDINGLRRPISYWRETVWGLRRDPYIVVHRPRNYGRPLADRPWSWDDVISSWAWDIEPGSPVVVDVYSDGDEVALMLNGDHLATERVGLDERGERRAFIARFEVEYRPGILTAVSRMNGEDTGHTTLRSLVGTPTIVARADRSEIENAPDELIYVDFTVADANATIAVDRETEISVTVSGPAELVALSSARPDDAQGFGGTTHWTYDGRLQAVLRPRGAGSVCVRAQAELGSAEVVISVR